MDEIKASVIIPTYNRLRTLSNTIKSLIKQNFCGHEIIVVDNACSEGVRILVEALNRDKNNKKLLIKYIQEPKIGLHNARHTGAKISRGKVLVYVDDDIIADPNLIEQLLIPYSNPEVGCVGGRILPKWEVEPPEWVKLFPKWYLSVLDDDSEIKEVQWIYGCNFSIRKELLFKLGGFNPDAFADKEMGWYRGDGEIGLLRKVHDIKMKVIYNPKAVVWHSITKDRLTVKYFKKRAFKSGIETSFSKYHYSNDALNIIKLFPRAFFFSIYFIFHNILAFIPNKARIKHKVTSSNYKARCFYELKLALDKNLKQFIKRSTYLE